MEVSGLVERMALCRRIRISALAPLLMIVALLVSPAAAVVPVFYTIQEPPGPRGELDSVVLWVAPGNSSALLFITDKTMDRVEIHDAINNAYIGTIGGSGSGLGQMARPNGIALAAALPSDHGPRDILLVAERDNDRVSAWLMPFLHPLGSFGPGEMSEPYGISVFAGNGVYEVWVTSTGTSPQSIQVYDLSWDDQTGVVAQLDRSFNVPPSAVLETIVVDPVSEKVLVCDEENQDIMVYSRPGSLLTRFGAGIFAEEAEGIGIYDTGDGSGYLVVSDQKSSPMQFEVFDRQTFAHIGAFVGSTADTDGLTLTQAVLPNLPNGALFAVHLDMTLHAYDWTDIASEVGLCVNECQTSDAGAGRVPGRARLLSNHPNPFNPATTIRFELVRDGQVALRVFDLQGRRIRTLLDRRMHPGSHQVAWRGRDDAGRLAPAGIYFLQLRTDRDVSTRKITLVK